MKNFFLVLILATMISCGQGSSKPETTQGNGEQAENTPTNGDQFCYLPHLYITRTIKAKKDLYQGLSLKEIVANIKAEYCSSN